MKLIYFEWIGLVLECMLEWNWLILKLHMNMIFEWTWIFHDKLEHVWLESIMTMNYNGLKIKEKGPMNETWENGPWQILNEPLTWIKRHEWILGGPKPNQW